MQVQQAEKVFQAMQNKGILPNQVEALDHPEL